MFRPALLSLAALAACSHAAPATSPDPVEPLAAMLGTEHPPRRAGITERSSYLIEESERGRWVVAELVVQAPAARAVSLDEIITGGTATTARWRTVAIQRVAAADSLLPLHLGTCEVSGRHDRLVVGLGKPSVTVAVRQAWRVDTIGRRFVAIDAATVHCVDLTGT